MTILLPRYRESTEEVVEALVSRALAAAERELDEVWRMSAGEVFFYRITPQKAFVTLAELEYEGHYDDQWYETLEDELDLIDAYEAVLS